jgi:hypothetical protein
MKYLDVEIEGFIYTGVVEEDGIHINIFYNYDEENQVYMGRYLLRNNELIEVFIMSNTEAVVGRVIP